MSFIQVFYTDNTYAPSTDYLRSALSATSSLTAYDAATEGTWVTITSAEYFNLSAVVPGATWRGLNNTQITSNATGTSFNGTLTVAMPSASQQIIPTGSYLIGFAVRPGTTNINYVFYPMIGYTYLSTYSNVGSAAYRTPASVGTTLASNVYFIRKAPTTSLSAQAYPAYAGNRLGSYQYLANTGTGTPMITAYATTQVNASYTAASAIPPWTNYNSNAPIFQILTTTLKNW